MNDKIDKIKDLIKELEMESQDRMPTISYGAFDPYDHYNEGYAKACKQTAESLKKIIES